MYELILSHALLKDKKSGIACFSMNLGIPLKQYILNRKLNASVHQIKHRSHTLTEIGSHFDFSTPAAFARAFKRQYAISPSALRKSPDLLKSESLSAVIQRPIKKLNGDIVTDFTLEQQAAFHVSGLVFQVDITKIDYVATIQAKFSALLRALNSEVDQSGYVIYSDCSPDQTIFNVIVGIKGQVTLDLLLFFTVEVPEILGVQITYSGEVYEMSEVLTSDFARFLRFTRLEAAQHDIHMIQHFYSIQDLDTSDQLVVSIKKNGWDICTSQFKRPDSLRIGPASLSIYVFYA